MKKTRFGMILMSKKLEKLKKIETEKLKKVNKIQRHKIRIKSVKDATKREREDLGIERINKLNKIEKKKKNEIRIEIKFNELANNLDIKLLE